MQDDGLEGIAVIANCCLQNRGFLWVAAVILHVRVLEEVGGYIHICYGYEYIYIYTYTYSVYHIPSSQGGSGKVYSLLAIAYCCAWNSAGRLSFNRHRRHKQFLPRTPIACLG